MAEFAENITQFTVQSRLFIFYMCYTICSILSFASSNLFNNPSFGCMF